MNVIVTDAITKQALAVTQSLGKRGIDVTCISSTPYAPAFYSKFCKNHFIAPGERDRDGFINFILDLVKKDKYELVVTCGDLSTEYLSEIRDKLLPYAKLALPGHESVLTVLNKDRLMKFCQEKSFPAPDTLYPKDLSDALSLSDKLGYPVVLKGTRGCGANNVRIVSSRKDFKDKYLELEKSGLKIILQEYVKGESLDFDGLYAEGMPLAQFMFRVIRAFPENGGNTSKAISIYDKQLEGSINKICNALNWTGAVNIDCKKDERTGEIKIIDINPRIGGPIAFAISCGVDIPLLLFDFVVKGLKESPKPYKLNKLFRSIFREEILYAYYRPTSILKMAFETLNPFTEYGFNIKDLKSFYMLIKNTKWEIEGRAKA